MPFSWLYRLSPAARALLSAERGLAEDEALKSRALARAEAALEGERWSGVGLRRAIEERELAAKSNRRRGAALVAAALAFGGLAFAGIRWVSQGEADPVRPPASTGTRVPPPGLTVVSNALPPRSVGVEVTPAPSSAAVSSVATGVPRARPSSVKQYAIELALLEPARTSIARGSYGAALNALAKHRREYPAGQLAEEREALRVRALWGAGQKTEARAVAASFRKRYPRSVLLSWMSTTDNP